MFVVLREQRNVEGDLVRVSIEGERGVLARRLTLSEARHWAFAHGHEVAGEQPQLYERSPTEPCPWGGLQGTSGLRG